jgi:hypothetical protein
MQDFKDWIEELGRAGKFDFLEATSGEATPAEPFLSPEQREAMEDFVDSCFDYWFNHVCRGRIPVTEADNLVANSLLKKARQCLPEARMTHTVLALLCGLWRTNSLQPLVALGYAFSLGMAYQWQLSRRKGEN